MSKELASQLAAIGTQLVAIAQKMSGTTDDTEEKDEEKSIKPKEIKKLVKTKKGKKTITFISGQGKDNTSVKKNRNPREKKKFDPKSLNAPGITYYDEKDKDVRVSRKG